MQETSNKYGEKFLSNVEKSSGCWKWIGANNYRYGVVRAFRRMMGAHRLSYLIYKGEIPEGMHVLHKCDNPLCVNPDHLFLGTNGDNMKDKTIKGRQAKGAKNAATKLTAEDVISIRKSIQNGESQKLLAIKYGVYGSTITRLKYRQTWDHLQ